MTSTQVGTVLRHIRRVGPVNRTVHPPDDQLLERFVGERDEDAFAVLVRRYSPMVLNVCRTVLSHEQDAEDALQATFLVFARKADSIRRRDSVAGWLYEVAHRVAARALASALRRRERERRALPTTSADSTLDMTLRDLHRVLHDELRRMPDKYRLPLVLCYLEGRSQQEAAGQLGWSKSTFRGRLDRGREHLRRRLTSRGIALSAVLCAAAVTPGVVAGGQVEAVVRVVSGDVPARTSSLAEGVIRAMFMSKLKVATTAVLVAASLAASAVVVTQSVRAGDEPRKALPAPGAKSPSLETRPPAANDANSTTYRGRVLGPDGRPAAGAKLYLTGTGGYYRHPSPVSESATSDADGQFEFAVSNAKFEDRWGAMVVAAAPNYGPGWVDLRPGAKRDDLVIRLVADDVPISGRVVDLQGKPIQNVALKVWQIHAAAGDDLGPWTEAAQGKKGLVLELEHKYFPRYVTALCPKVTTDANGQFRLSGIGRNRLVRALLEGPTIATQHICILTRPGTPIEVVYHKGNREYGEPPQLTTYYPADFRLAAAPCQPVVGVVRDADTKKPIAGATVRSHSQLIAPGSFRTLDPVVQATTDSEGRYRLAGMPTGKGYSIAVFPGNNQPYVARHVDVPDGVGVKQVTADVELKRGVWIEGKITDKVTGKPLKGSVEYFSMYNNPNRPDFPDYDGTFLMGDLWAHSKDDGSYRIVGLPGPGLICVYYQRDPYLRADEREDEFGTKEKSFRTSPYHLSFTSNYNAIAKVDPAKSAESVRCDVTIDPGWSFKASVLGPDGKPLTGARSFNLNCDRMWGESMKSAEFTGGFNPRRLSDLVVVHQEGRLVGTAQLPKQDGGAVAVKLQPAASAKGRLVDADGKPLAGVELELSFRPKERGGWNAYLPQRIKTDRDGVFHIQVLIPGYHYRLQEDRGELEFGDGLRSGQANELGDVRLKRSGE